MRYPIFIQACFALCLFTVQPIYAVKTFNAVGVYDSDTQSNAVDKSASYDPDYSTGVGKTPELVLGVDDFAPLIQAVYTNIHGGVVNFDNGLIPAGEQNDSFAALFNGKALLFQSVDHLRSDYVSSSRTPVSGPGKSPNGGFLAKSTVKGDACTIGGSYQFTLTEYGFEPGEHVRVMTGTILGRNNSDKDGKWIMKVTLDNGDVVAASAKVDLATGNTSADTFFGVYAPAGRHITAVAWTAYSGEYSGLDDVAFITSTTNFALPKIEIAANPPDDSPPIGNPPIENPPTGNPNALTLFGIPISSGGDDADEDSNNNYSSLFGSDKPSTR